MKKLVASVAFVAIAGAAHAQDAYITQIGDDHVAVNYSEYNQSGNTNRDNLQVIAQQGIGHQAATFTRGSNNTAYTYQLDLTNNFANNGTSDGATLESLIWQQGGFGTGNNTAVAVQLVNQSPGTKGTYVSQIIQRGTGNTAINWAQNAGGAMAGSTFGSISVPTIGFNPQAAPVPTPIAATTVPYGTSVTVN